MKILWILTAISSVLGLFVLVVTLFASNGAPQQAAGAAVAIGFAVIPYCFCRALQPLKPRVVEIKSKE